jgi:hypothetical protein
VVIDYVVVKGGNGGQGPGFNVYSGPAVNVDQGGLVAANGFSHWFVCYHSHTLAQPSVTTTLSPANGNITAGGTFSDSATVTGLVSPSAGDTVTFDVYSSSACSGTALYSGSGTLSSGSAASGTLGPITTAGTYYVQATFNGDINNASAKSTCGTEVVTVGQTHPSVSTTLNPESGSITAGGTFSDSAMVTGLVSPSSADTVTFDVYSSSACTGTVLFTGTGTLSGGSASSGSLGPLGAGTYYVQATFNGDINNAAASSTCGTEVVRVGQTGPSVSTTLNPESGDITAGGTFSDSATVTGLVSPSEGDMVTFDVYSSSACTGTVLFSSSGTLTDGSASSGTLGPIDAVGTYYVQATFNGDTNNAAASSPCGTEVVSVGQTSPSVSTTLNPANGSITAGGTFSDSASVLGLVSPSEGDTVTFDVYSSSTCTGTVLFTGTGTLSDGSASSGSLGPIDNMGTYYVQATFNGDTNNAAASSSCGTEKVSVGQTHPSVSTALTPENGSITAGGTFSDSASVTGLVSPSVGDTVTFDVYSSSDCTGDTLFSSTGGVLSDGSASSGSLGPITNVGTYYVQATFNGDSNNASATSACGTEVVTVGQAQPTINTQTSSASTVAPGTFTDTATVSGGDSPTGTVTFNAYTGTSVDACSGTPAATNTEPLSSGSSTSAPFALAVGSYEVQAVYSGDTNNLSATSACGSEPFTVTAPPTPSIKTVASDSGDSLVLGSTGTLSDTATVTGVSGGTVTFYQCGPLGSSGPCSSETATSTSGPLTLSGGTVTWSTQFTPTQAGWYCFGAAYNPVELPSLASARVALVLSDNTTTDNLDPSECLDVTSPPSSPPASPPPAASLSTTPTVTGTSATDAATVSGTSGTPTGTVTFTLYSGTPGSGTLVAGFAADTVTLVSGSATSASTGALPVGSYYFSVTYSGGGGYGAIPAKTETFSIAVQTPTLSTTPNVTGLSATDSATVSATSGTPTGTVTFTLYSGAPGSGTQVAGFSDTETLSGGSALSISTGALAAGSYYFLVSYSGDANFSVITASTPEAFTIVPTSAPKPPKTKTPPYKIPTSAPSTGAGGAAGVTFNGGLLSVGSLLLLAGLAVVALSRRRRNA